MPLTLVPTNGPAAHLGMARDPARERRKTNPRRPPPRHRASELPSLPGMTSNRMLYLPPEMQELIKL